MCASLVSAPRSLNAREALLYEYTHEVEVLKDSVYSRTEKVIAGCMYSVKVYSGAACYTEESACLCLLLCMHMM